MVKNVSKFLIVLWVMACISSCSQGAGKLFTLLSSRKTGIKFKNVIKETENFNHLKYSYLYNGAGVAIGDINNDGLSDIYFTGNLASCRLYLNKGDFEFEDITTESGVAAKETWNNGATMADINGDGFLDIYVCSSTDGRPKYRKNLLFINNGDLTFSERAQQYGIEDPAYSTHSAFFDYDKDGDLDLFILNHSLDRYTAFNESSITYKNVYDSKFGQKLFRNDGEKFSDVTKVTGINSNVINYGLGIAVSDFNNDHWPDIYVCNDFYEQDYLYINQKDGTFSEQLEKYFSHISFSSMGCDAADINNDGYIDLFTLDMLPEDNIEKKLVAGPHNYEKFKLLETRGFYYQTTRNMLQLNNDGQYFTEIGQYAGVFSTNWSWSPLLCDFDNDGWKDLFITNGYGKNNTHMDVLSLLVENIERQQSGDRGMNDMDIVNKIPATILKNYMFKNNGDYTFKSVHKEWGIDTPTLSNGAAYADLDNDGDMDLVISNINDYAFIYRNNAEKVSNNNYLKIKLIGSGRNTGGIGARIDIKCNNQKYTQEFMPSRGYMSSVDHTIIFGLGDAKSIDSMQITWPDLRVQILTELEVDQTIILKNNNAVEVVTEDKSAPRTIFNPVKNNPPMQFKHQENEYIDFTKQPLLPYLLSTQGPLTAIGDVNNDGLDDIYIGGAKGFTGSLYVQQNNDLFVKKEIECFEKDKYSEDLGVLFFDVDRDHDLDLYVVSGGNEFTITSNELQDRLYLNDGSGVFEKSIGYLPEMLCSGSCVKASDIDNDGDEDLFVGGRLTPGLYPISPRSYILENDGDGHFQDVTVKKNSALVNPGMVTDAVWSDFNGDNLQDLILIGEWMSIRLFRNTGNELIELSDQSWMDCSKGWWNRIFPGDFDNDGDVDYIIGNLGLNSQFKASVNEPVNLYASDFDHNGSLDAVLCTYINGKNYPIYSKQDLASQIKVIDKKYPTFKSYADQTITDIFSKTEINESLLLEVNNFSTSYLKNNGNNQFELSPLPVNAQLSPVYGIHADDFDGDGNLDMILAGNFFGFRIAYGRYDANKGLLLMGDGRGNFETVSNSISGLNVNGEVRDISIIRLASGKELLIFALNNEEFKLYKFNHDKTDDIKL